MKSEIKNQIESLAEVALLVGSDVIVFHAGVVVKVTGCMHLFSHLERRVGNVENMVSMCIC